MNLIKMLEDQQKLDELIFKNSGIEKYPTEMMKTAYRVELGEFLNEWQGFKYWKQNKTISKKNFLLEFADCLHFALSLENNSKFYTDERYKSIEADLKNYVYARLDIYKAIDSCYECLPSILINTIVMGYKMGITLDEMERAYYYKYKINIERQNNGY